MTPPAARFLAPLLPALLALLLAGLAAAPAAAQCSELWIDPPVIEEHGLFGAGLALERGLLVVGADGIDTSVCCVSQGVVQVLREGPLGWTLEATFEAPPAGNPNVYGNPIVIDGDRIAWAWDDSGDLRAEVRRDAGGGLWIDEGGVSVGNGDRASVALSGDRLAVGNDFDRVFLFRFDGVDWVPDGELVSPLGAAEDFGTALAWDGDRLAVGAAADDDAATGSVWIYRDTGAGFVREARLLPPDVGPDDGWGWVLDLDGDTLVVSAAIQAGPQGARGALYLHERVGTSWSLVQKLVVREPNAFLGFPVVDLDGDALVASASAPGPLVAYYRFRRVGGAFQFEAAAVPAGLTANDGFGLGLAVDGARVVAGAPSKETAGTEQAGAVVLHEYAPGCGDGDDQRR